MRGALKPLPGISKVDITAGEKAFSVEYDPKKVDVDKILAALEASGEKAKLKS